jgi:hypothetical protein
MALRLGALHDALLHPGDPTLAQRAAEEVANYEGRLARVEADLTVIKWMVGTNIALVLVVLSIVLRLAARS